MKLLIWISVALSVFLILSAYHPTLMKMPVTAGIDFSMGEAQSVGAGLKQIDLLTIIGGIIVFVFYWSKFGKWHGEGGAPPGFKPQPTRHFTTWLRYSSWACFYAAIMVACYLLIVLFPAIFLMILRLIASMKVHGDVSLSQDMLSLMQTAILQNDRSLNSAALAPYAVIVVILIWAGTCKKLERKARRKLQESALIPNEAQGLIYKLQEIVTRADGQELPSGAGNDQAIFRPKRERIDKIVENVPTLISEKDFTDSDEAYLEKYCQCLYFYERLKELRAESGSAEIWQIYGDDLKEVDKGLEALQSELEHHHDELVQALKYAQQLVKYEKDYRDFNRQVKELHAMLSNTDGAQESDVSPEDLKTGFQRKRIEFHAKVNSILAGINDPSPLATMLRNPAEENLAVEALTLGQIKESRKDTAVEKLPFERRYFRRAENRLEQRIEGFRTLLHQVIVCGILSVGKSYNRRAQMFADLDLEVPELSGLPLNRNFVFKVCLFIAGWVGLSTLSYGYMLKGGAPVGGCEKFAVPYPEGFGGAIIWTTSAVIMHALGVIGAYLIENALLIDHKYFPQSIAARLINTDFGLAFLFGFSLNIFFFALMLSFEQQFAGLAQQWKWALIPGVTAYFTSFYISQSKRKLSFNWYFVGLQGLGTGLMTTIALLWIWNVSPQELGDIVGCSNAFAFSIYCVVSSLILGAALSYLSQKIIPRKEG